MHRALLLLALAPASLRAQAPACAAPRVVAAEPGETVIAWKGTKFRGAGKHEGRVALARGEVARCGERLDATFVVDMRSIEVTDIPASDPVPRRNLTEHLHADDFFWTARFPEATLRAAAPAAPRPDGTWTLSGELVIRGIARPVTFAARRVPCAAPACLEATVVFSRRAHGITWRRDRVRNMLVDDPVTLRIVLALRDELP